MLQVCSNCPIIFYKNSFSATKLQESFAAGSRLEFQETVTLMTKFVLLAASLHRLAMFTSLDIPSATTDGTTPTLMLSVDPSVSSGHQISPLRVSLESLIHILS